MISKHAKFVEINSNTFALYNNFIMDVLIVNKKERDEIIAEKISDNNFKKTLERSGIYIKNPGVDSKALEKLRNIYLNNVGKIDILYLIVTNNCNLRCKYCFLENNPLCPKERENMSLSTALKAIEKFANHLQKNNKKNATILFYGGEPTLKIDIIKQSIDYARKFPIDFEFTIITNGTNVTQENAEYFKKNNVNLGLSIDGPQDITDENRKFKNSNEGVFKVVWKSKKLLDQNDVSYGLSMVVSDYFLANQNKIIAWLKENHNRGIYYNLLHFDKYDDKNDLHSKNSAKFIIKSYENFEKDCPTLLDGRIQRQINSFYNKEFIFSDCGAVGLNQITILPDGSTCICHGDSSNKEKSLGNIDDIDLDKIIELEKAKYWINRSTLYNNECLSCEALFCCGGGCPHHAEVINCDNNSLDKNYCIYSKEILKWMLKRAYDNSIN